MILPVLLSGCGVSVEFLNPFARENPTGIPFKKYSAQKHFEFGQLFLDKGELKKARFQFERALRKAPTFFRARISLGNIQLKKRNYHRAADHFSDVLSDHPHNPSAMSNLAWCWIKMDKKLDSAISLLHEATVHHPKYASSFQDSIAYAYLKKDKPETALKILDRLLRKTSVQKNQYQYIFFHRALALKKLEKSWKPSYHLSTYLCRSEELEADLKRFAKRSLKQDLSVPYFERSTKTGTGNNDSWLTEQHRNDWIRAAVHCLVDGLRPEMNGLESIRVEPRDRLKSKGKKSGRGGFTKLLEVVRSRVEEEGITPTGEKPPSDSGAKLIVVRTREHLIFGILLRNGDQKRKYRSIRVPFWIGKRANDEGNED